MFRIGANRELPIIMAIDDDMVSREVVATLLTLNGYTVHTAIDGEDSLRLLESDECVPQVILMDAQLPGIRGAELVEQLRQRTKAYIYAVSGSRPSQELLASADGFLMKPFDVTALKKLLEGHIPQSSMPTPDHSEAVLNPKTLAQFRQMMPEPMVREIYVAVTADLKKRHASLRTAIAQGDTAEIRRIGHAIKGGCGMAGALQAARLGAMLEAESDQLYNSEKVLRDLHTAMQNLERMLDTEFPA
jgi:CheY-like chemotaxis protein